MNRRDFLTTAAIAASAVALNPGAVQAAAPRLVDSGGHPIKLGMDNFSVRALGWKGRPLVDYAASLNLDTLFITDLPALGTLEPTAVQELRKYAADKGVELQLGSWSICPTSTVFKSTWGTAEEHLALGIRLAKAAGSGIFRVVLGTREDRKTPGGIDARIDDTVKVLKSQRSLALDSGIKITVENHAGDMTAVELIRLMESAGKDFVGANMDSGNATWTLEDPMNSLELLGPYCASTSLRDSNVWETDQGCKVQWTAFGEGGCVDWAAYFKRYTQLCPGVPVNIETIGGFVVDFPYLTPAFWDAFPKKPAAEFARFLSVAKRGRAIAQYDANEPDRQRFELEKSVRYLREVIGLGTK